MKRLDDERELDTVMRAGLAIIYKHSPWCGLSDIAAAEVRRFMDRNPDVPVYLLDVIAQRPLAVAVEERLGIRHESPQVILIRDGEPAWDASHRAVTAEALDREAAA